MKLIKKISSKNKNKINIKKINNHSENNSSKSKLKLKTVHSKKNINLDLIEKKIKESTGLDRNKKKIVRMKKKRIILNALKMAIHSLIFINQEIKFLTKMF